MKTIIRITSFVQQYWFMLVLAFLCIIIATGFGIVIPRMLGDGIDTVIGMGKHSAIYLAAVVIVVASALRGFAGYGQRYFAEVVAQKVSYNIRNALYGRLQRLSFSFHDRNQTGQLMSRATVDVEATRMFFSMGLLGMAQVVLMFIGVAYMLLSMNWQLGLMTLAGSRP
jgi:ATP-binding cassette subfamily B multidrug efflux pump